MWNNSLRELWNIAPSSQCEIKFATSDLRSKYFTAKLFHMAKPYFTRRRRISLKKALAYASAFFMAAPVRLELTTLGLTVRCSTDWAKGQYWILETGYTTRDASCGVLFGDPWENRTPVCGVRGRRLDRLTNGPEKEKVPAPTYPPGSSPTKYFRHDRA